MTAGLTRREALCAGSSLCAAATLPAPRDSSKREVERIIADATRAPRAMRDGEGPYSEPSGQLGHLPNNSYDYAVETANRSRSVLARAKRLRTSRLTPADQEDVDTLIWDLGCDVGLAPYYYHEFPLGYSNSQLASLKREFLAPPAAIETGEYLLRAAQAPSYVDNIRLRLLGQLERGLTAPRAEGERAAEQFKTESKEVASALTAAGAPHGGAFANDLRRIVEGPLAAALAALQETFERKYIPALSEQSRMALSNDAPEYFRQLSNARTSDQLDMARTFQDASEALSEIDADLARMRKDLGGPADPAAFYKSMVGNPRWFVRDAADLKSRFDAAIAGVTPLVPRYFRRMPTTPFRAAPLPDFLSERLLNGYFSGPSKADSRGTYFYNTAHLDIANWSWVKPMVSHELMPGHHYQAALLFERADLSPYRRGIFVGAVAEGWGEYARRLMEEAGFYDGDPWGLYASRLLDRRFVLRTVVECGVSHPDWTWQKADEQLATDPLTRPETTRQIALSAATFRSPGLLYWWGLKRFFGLRETARSRAGASFDIRDFHERVMTGELQPFDVLQKRVLA